jgi:UDP-glucose:(heptosyl)LPS alpha-1,3-glucosyltransferase
MSDSLPPVLLVAAHLDPARGGQERSITEYAEQLTRMGLEVEFASLDASLSLARVLDAASRAASEHRESHLVQSMLPVPRAHVYLPRGGLYAEAHLRSARSRRSAPLRAAARLVGSFNSDRRLLRRRESEILRDPQGPLLVALSDYVAEQARRHYGVQDSRMRIVRNGVDVDPDVLSRVDVAAQRRLRGVAEGETVFLAVAHNHRLKGIPELVRAAQALPRQDSFQVLVLGGRKREPDPSARVRYLGSVPDTLPDLAMADVLVHPTFYDPSSRVVLEAIAAGKPVITTRWNGASDFLARGGGIVIEDPRDTRALSAAMRCYLDRDARQLAVEGAAPVRADVSMERHARMMVDLFKQLT